jgi:hypothetical protein
MSAVDREVLRELGWRLRHHCAAQSVDPDALAEHIGTTPENFALTLGGSHKLPFSTVCAILDHLNLDWWQFYGTEFPHHRTVHEVPLDSDTWQAMASGVQPFDIRQDGDRYRAGDWLYVYERIDTTWTGRVLIMEVTYLLYLASLGLPAGYVAMALRPVEESQLSANTPPLTAAQQAELRIRLDAYANAPQDRRLWEEEEDSIPTPGREPPETLRNTYPHTRDNE